MMSQKQLLIVEDNELNRAMLREILSSKYQVLEAGNGQEALDILKQAKNDIALILLDVMMPVMDGYTFLEHLKADAELSLIPVIVMTQSGDENDEVSALAHGATDFVPKPYRPRVIQHRVASIIKLRETASIVNQFKYDRLTGLYSREFFYQKASDRMQEFPEKEYTIVSSNIENFKLYNDTFGVKEGDNLLKQIAEMLRRMMEKGTIIGRFSADRFVCLVERSWEQDNRNRLLNNDITMTKNITMKWGIYEITDRTIPVEHMCDRALLAADNIKGLYNNHFAVYDDALRGKLLREQAITEIMDTALAEEQFLVYFQPKYSLKEGGIAGAEALVRWINPELGFMSPGEFIPLFEKNGFISRLDRYVWEKVCAQIHIWKEQGYPVPPVSVNVSRADIYQMNLADVLLDIVKKYDVEPRELHLEITESAYTENPSQIISAVDQLRSRGFIIEMDDFGSGYSSLNMLNQMKMDILKLDMKFVQNETALPMEKSILQFIVGLAHGMSLRVVAEGVETKEQVERLREIDCDYVQGYFFGKPMPDLEFQELLKEQSLVVRVPATDNFEKKESMRKILVVDENEQFRSKTRKTFESRYQVLEASDMQSAVSCIKEQGMEVVSAVILSMTIPDDGANKFLYYLKHSPMLWQIPVLATIPRGELAEVLLPDLETDDFLCKCHPQRDLYRRVERIIDLSACREREKILRDEAERDYLTGLLNRRGLQSAIDSLCKQDLPVTILLFDLDDLKIVNDTFGHDEGDRIIQTFAEMLRCQIRSDDIVCRYGGDEFAVILRNTNNADDARKKGERICELFKKLLQDGDVRCTVSVGIATGVMDEKPSDAMIERADQALYQAKENHKGGCCLWCENECGKNE